MDYKMYILFKIIIFVLILNKSNSKDLDPPFEFDLFKINTNIIILNRMYIL